MAFWVFFSIFQYQSKKKKKVHIKKPQHCKSIQFNFFINLTLKTTENGSKEEVLPQD